MIDVVRDMEGMRMAFTEIFERDFDQARIARSAETASAETRERLIASVAPLKLSPGYHRYAYHLMSLEAEQEAGIALDPRLLAAFEAAGLRCLSRARNAFKSAHPPCNKCGTLQSSRFNGACEGCGVKFQRKG